MTCLYIFVYKSQLLLLLRKLYGHHSNKLSSAILAYFSFQAFAKQTIDWPNGIMKSCHLCSWKADA